MTRSDITDPSTRIMHDVDQLCNSGELHARLRIPDTASDMRLVTDLRSRTIRVSMEVEAPRDKQRTSSRIKWLLRQLKDVDPLDTVIRIKWASRAADTDILLSELQDDQKATETFQSKVPPRAFEVIMSSSSGQRFKGRRTFIEEVETICPQFYECIGQHLKSWQPSPPKPKTCPQAEDHTQGSAAHKRPAGNDHSCLLEVPKFLLRTTDSPSDVQTPDAEPKHRQVSRFRAHYLVQN